MRTSNATKYVRKKQEGNIPSVNDLRKCVACGDLRIFNPYSFTKSQQQYIKIHSYHCPSCISILIK